MSDTTAGRPNPPAPLPLPRGNLLLIGSGAISVAFTPGWANLLRTWYPNLSIRSVLTFSAEALVSAKAISAVSGHPVVTQDNGRESPAVSHRALAAWSDLVIVLPATANYLSKLAHAMTESIALLVCAVTTSPVILVPSVPQRIWQSAPMQQNVTLLKQAGYWLCEPRAGVTVAQREPEMGGPPDIAHVLRFTSDVLSRITTENGNNK